MDVRPIPRDVCWIEDLPGFMRIEEIDLGAARRLRGPDLVSFGLQVGGQAYSEATIAGLQLKYVPT